MGGCDIALWLTDSFAGAWELPLPAGFTVPQMALHAGGVDCHVSPNLNATLTKQLHGLLHLLE